MPRISQVTIAISVIWASVALADSDSVLSELEAMRAEIASANSEIEKNAIEMKGLRAEIATLNEQNKIVVFDCDGTEPLSYNCTLRQCKEACEAKDSRMVSLMEMVNWSTSQQKNICAYMWVNYFAIDRHRTYGVRAYPMYHNDRGPGCQSTINGTVLVMDGSAYATFDQPGDDASGKKVAACACTKRPF